MRVCAQHAPGRNRCAACPTCLSTGAFAPALTVPWGRTTLAAVLRFLIFLLVALSLPLAPSRASTMHSTDCSMSGALAEMGATDEEKVGCCTPECAPPVVAAILPLSGNTNPIVAATAARLLPGASALTSVDPAAADPPPRACLA